jgi:CRP/FNR family transcriptional regulator, cyclic AMP receptor protein
LIRLLAQRGVVQHIPKGEIFIREKETGNTLFLILTGRVRAFFVNKSNREMTLGVYQSGEYVGEMALDGGPRLANVIALEPTVCSVIEYNTLVDFVTEHPPFGIELLTRVIRRARVTSEHARDLAFIDVYGRLQLLLCEMSLPPNAEGKRQIPQKYTHQELANLVGCSREMISRILKDLVRGGYIEVDQKFITLCKALPHRW